MIPAAEGVFAPALRLTTVGLLISVGIVAFDGLGVTTALPAIATELGGVATYGWAVSALMLASVAGTVIAGFVADQHDPRVPYLTGFGIFAVGLVASGLATNWALFLLGRVIQGLGVGAILSMAYVFIGRPTRMTCGPGPWPCCLVRGRLGIAARAVLSLACFGIEVFLPLAMTELRGASLFTAGLTLAAGALVWVAESARRVPARQCGSVGVEARWAPLVECPRVSAGVSRRRQHVQGLGPTCFSVERTTTHGGPLNTEGPGAHGFVPARQVRPSFGGEFASRGRNRAETRRHRVGALHVLAGSRYAHCVRYSIILLGQPRLLELVWMGLLQLDDCRHAPRRRDEVMTSYT